MAGGDRNVPKQRAAMRNKMCVHSLHFSLVQISHLETGARALPRLLCGDGAFRTVNSAGRAAQFLS